MTLTATRTAADRDVPAARRGHGWLVAGFLLLLVVVGALLRADPLGPSSLWLDDAAPALSARADSLHLVLVTGMTAPGFALLLRGVFEVAGFSELTAQALPFVLGVAGAPLAWWAARRAGLHGGAVLAAVVVLASPVHVTYSSRVKPYTLDLVLCLLVLAAAFVVLRGPGLRRPWWVLAGASAVGVFLSAAVLPTVVAAFAGTWLAALRRRELGRDAVLASTTAGVTALLVWALLVRPASTRGLEDIWRPFFLPLDATWPLALGDRTSLVASGLLPLPGALAAALLLAAVVAVVVRRGPAVGLLLVGPFALTAAGATLGAIPLGGGRTDVQLFASLALLLGGALDGAGRWARSGVAAAAVAGVALVALTPPPVPYLEQDVRPLVASLEEQRSPTDGVIVYSATRWAYGIYTPGPVRVVQTDTQANNFDPVPTDPRVHVLRAHRAEPEGHREDVRGFACDHARVWFLSSHTTADIAVAQDELGRIGFALAGQEDRPGATLQRWERPTAGC